MRYHIVMSDLLDVRDAAHELGVSPERVRQLIDDGELAAERIAHVWAVHTDSVHRRAQVDVASGRPWAARQVWRLAAMVDLALRGRDEDAASYNRAIGPQAAWRLRRYCADLADEDDPRNVAWRLRGRADEIIERYGHPSVLEELADDPRLWVSGAHAAAERGVDLVPDEFVDAYAHPSHLADVIAGCRLVQGEGQPNVRLRVVDKVESWQQVPVPDDHGAPLLLVAADLSERADARSSVAADRLWGQLRAQLRSMVS